MSSRLGRRTSRLLERDAALLGQAEQPVEVAPAARSVSMLTSLPATSTAPETRERTSSTPRPPLRREADHGARGRGSAPSSSVAALGDDPAVAQDRHPVGEVLGLVHVVGGEEDGLAERLQPLDHVPGVAAGGRVEAGGRLVEEDQVGVADDPDRDVGAAFLPAGEGADARVALLAEADQLDRLLDRARRRGRSVAKSAIASRTVRAGRARTPAGPGRRGCASRGSGAPGSTPSTETSPPLRAR